MEDIECILPMTRHGKTEHLMQVIIKARITFPNAMHLDTLLEIFAMKRSR